MKKILIVSKCPTHSTNAGNKSWILAQTKILQELGNKVYFLYIQELPIKQDKIGYEIDLRETSKYWDNNFYLYKVSKFQKIIFNIRKRIDNIFYDNFYTVDETYPWGLDEYVNKLDAQINFDVCIVNYAYLTKLLTKIHIPKKALFTHDCLAYKNLKVGNSCRTMTAHQEAIAMQRSPHIFALQDNEMAYFQMLSPNSCVYNVYCKYDYYHQPVVGNKNILFLSGSNEYNQNGIRWFCRDIFPFIKERFSETCLLIGGGICKTITDLGDIEGVKLLGYVDKLEDFYAMGDVAINPVYQGTGLKIKTFEAISYDKVTMVHPHSTIGIFNKDEAPLFASVQPKEWVEHLTLIWNNPNHIKQMKEQNKKYIQDMNEFILCEYKKFLDDEKQ